MEVMTSIGNCPNCGAPIRGDECPYCGTMFTKNMTGIPIYDVDGTLITTLLSNGLITANEARERLGLDPIPREKHFL